MENIVTKSEESISKHTESEDPNSNDEIIKKVIEKFFKELIVNPVDESQMRKLGAKWFWNSNNNSEVIKEEWTLYTPEENEIIEKAYIEKKLRVELKSYIIDFEAMIQFHRQDNLWRTRTVKREIELERVLDKLPEPKQTTVNSITNMKHPMILMKYVQNYYDKYDPQKIMETILGEIKEIKNKKVLKRINSMKSFDDFKSFCISLYTSGDLYKSINKILREENVNSQELMNYMSFLNFILREDLVMKRWQKTVYRGTFLEKEDIEKYKEIWKSDYPGFQWSSFTSTTKNKGVAEMFSKNVLFVIDFFQNTFGIDINEHSLFYYEEEVLIPASSAFKITNILEKNNSYEISLIKIDTKFNDSETKDFMSKNDKLIKLYGSNYNPHKSRIYKEIDSLSKEKSLKFKFDVNDFTFKFLFKGPSGTPYEDGIFQLDIDPFTGYPFRPPKCKFDTPVWHPNVSSKTGIICMDILNSGWSLALTIEKLVYSIMSLLSEPNFSDPFDIIVADSYISNPSSYEKIVRDWVNKYANIKDFI